MSEESNTVTIEAQMMADCTNCAAAYKKDLCKSLPYKCHHTSIVAGYWVDITNQDKINS